MKAKLALSMVIAATFTLAVGQTAQADNKLADGAKAVGRGIMWAPKKICTGLGKGCKAIGNGMKKMVGK